MADKRGNFTFENDDAAYVLHLLITRALADSAWAKTLPLLVKKITGIKRRLIDDMCETAMMC